LKHNNRRNIAHQWPGNLIIHWQLTDKQFVISEVYSMRRIAFILTATILVGCATSPDTGFNLFGSREPASYNVFRRFIEKVVSGNAKRYTVQKLEREILDYIKRKPSQARFGNWAHVGLSADEAKNIRSLKDNHKYMPKVRKWVAENLLRIIPNLTKKSVADAFDILVKSGRYAKNPYRGTSSVTSSVHSRRSSIRPGNQYRIPDQRVRVLEQINKQPTKFKTLYKDTMAIFVQRGKGNPAIRQNGIEIIESASEITRLTGLSGMGRGCKTFARNAPERILASKANIEAYRLKEVRKLATSRKVTQKDLDEITVKAFREVQGLTNDEARLFVRTLKKSPCSHY
jgi:hypothetical protein